MTDVHVVRRLTEEMFGFLPIFGIDGLPFDIESPGMMRALHPGNGRQELHRNSSGLAGIGEGIGGGVEKDG